MHRDNKIKTGKIWQYRQSLLDLWSRSSVSAVSKYKVARRHPSLSIYH
jgi:hypothetical protein